MKIYTQEEVQVMKLQEKANIAKIKKAVTKVQNENKEKKDDLIFKHELERIMSNFDLIDVKEKQLV